MTPPLRKQDFTRPLPLMNRLMPEEFHQPDEAFADDHRLAVFGVKDKIGRGPGTYAENEMRNGIRGLENFSIREVIDKTMVENFDYEQRTVNQLFERYQRYKPIVSGLWG